MSKSAWFWGKVNKGGPTSGNYGHKGRPGIKGGSMPGGGHGAIGAGFGSGVDTLDFIKNYRQQKKPKAKKPKSTGPALPGNPPPTITKDTDPGLDEWFQEAAGGAWKYISQEGDFTRIRQLATGISTEAGISELNAARIGLNWAKTSNDSNVAALTLQERASEKFDVPLSAWQRSKLEEETKYAVGPFPEEEKAAMDKYLDVMRKRTQGEFAKRGYKPTDMVTLYRGIGNENVGLVGDNVALEQNAISSWSIDYGVANGFAAMAGSSLQNSGTILSMKVPVSSIVGSGITGFGCVREGEMIVLGVPGSQAKIVGYGNV